VEAFLGFSLRWCEPRLVEWFCKINLWFCSVAAALGPGRKPEIAAAAGINSRQKPLILRDFPPLDFMLSKASICCLEWRCSSLSQAVRLSVEKANIC